MKYRIFASPHKTMWALATCFAVSAISPFVFAADASKSSTYKAPRTADGHPDLQGNWTNATITPFERPTQFGERRALTKDEAAKLEQGEADRVVEGAKPTDPRKGIKDLPVNCAPGFSGTNCGYNNFWIDSGTQVVRVDGELRSSILVQPANGKMPPLTDKARQRMTERMAARRGAGATDGPEIRSLGERCLMSFGSSAGPPMLPLLYNNNYQIVQSKDTTLILVEMVHDARVIRMNGQPLPSKIKKWMGDSVGHWDGETLVIETTNINPLQNQRGGSEKMKITERLTRVAPNQILYQFKVEDPDTFVEPYAGELNMNASKDAIYEYACHEGNYALPGILAGAREEERVAAEKGGEKK